MSAVVWFLVGYIVGADMELTPAVLNELLLLLGDFQTLAWAFGLIGIGLVGWGCLHMEREVQLLGIVVLAGVVVFTWTLPMAHAALIDCAATQPAYLHQGFEGLP